MCLNRLDTKVKEKYSKQRSGYKVFLLHGVDELSCTDQGHTDAKPRGEWLDEASYRRSDYKYSSNLSPYRYRLGFHVCLTLQGATHWARMVRDNGHACKVVHVNFKYPTAWGYQDRHPMAVARQIKILEDA